MKKKASSQASWSILSAGVSASRVEAHIVRSHVNQMVEAIKEHPKLAEEVFKRCGDNFEAIPKHLSKMERSLDRTNYALITMGSDWYRQRLTHEDREMVDMAAKYNPTPFPSTNKQSEDIMKRQSSIKHLLIEAIEKHEPMLYIYDPEFRDELSEKYDALWSGDFEKALSLTRDRRVKKVLNRILKDMEVVGMRRSASFKDILIDLIDKYQDWFEALDPEYIDGGSGEAERKYDALHSGDLDTAISLTRDRRVKKVLLNIKSEIDSLSPTRRSASEVISNLENRVSNLETKTASSFIYKYNASVHGWSRGQRFK